MSTSEGKCVLLEVGALISWCIYSYRIVMLLVPYMSASMTFWPMFLSFIKETNFSFSVIKRMTSGQSQIRILASISYWP